jgi:crotonobetainyl-CoA:carnitine CoA-transferase CaiB-like acyl-CoA transferase
MNQRSRTLTEIAWSAVGGEADAVKEIVFTAKGGLASAFPVADVAAATIATAGLAVADLLHEAGGRVAHVTVDRRLSSMWFGFSLRPLEWRPPAPWDPIAGDYRARDGWVRLHTNAPHHRAAAVRVLGVEADRETVARTVARWSKSDLEAAVIEAGGCAAEMRSIAEWDRHAQGRAVAAEPLVHMAATEPAARPTWSLPPERPLRGMRVLDLTRVLAGPVATRFLAGYGAEVLRIDAPDWDEPGVVPEVTLGKRCARLDLRESRGRARFEALLRGADVLLHGYRPGALDRLGLDSATRRRLSPGLIDVTLSAYGWSGPWAARRGFDSLVQMSAGIAERGMIWRGADKPVPLPVQALDHATGYLMAAAAIRGIKCRMRRGNGVAARLSLARTARLLIEHASDSEEGPFAAETECDRSAEIELTDWGSARRLLSPAQIGDAGMRWDYPARQLGSAEPRWLDE